LEGLTVWLEGAGGAPSDKLIRIDYNADGKTTSTFPEALTILSRLAPLLVIPGYIMRLDHDLKKACVLLRLEPRIAVDT
jgi:hypothetical protein